MDQSAYITGFFGVLIGITVTELVKGIADTIKNSKRVKYYIPHGILVFSFFLFIVQNFFDFQIFLKDVTSWTPLLVIRFAVPWIIICLGSYLIFPSFEGDSVISFKDHFINFSLGAFKFAVVLGPIIIWLNYAIRGWGILHFENLFIMLFLILILLAMFFKKDWMIVILTCAGGCYLLYHIITYNY